MANPSQQPPEDKDLGLSGRVAQSTQERIMRPDGSLNVVRLGQNFWQSLDIYQHLLRTTWPRFIAYVGLFYAVANSLFAALFVAAGPDSIRGGDPATPWHNAFFFSVQTIATIGYGQMTPHGLIANSLVAVESLLGLMGFALITGILFARFSRPNARVLRSNVALIAPYKDGKALMFRIANGSFSQLIEIHATVTYSRMERAASGELRRRFYNLTLERDEVMLLPTQWVIVHPITPDSPFHGITSQAALLADDPELFVLLTALDETFSQTVHTRFSYADAQFIYGAKFDDPFHSSHSGVVTIDLSKLSNHSPINLPA